MTRSSEKTSNLSPVVGFAIAIAFLYFAKALLIPLVFALFLAFLLSPVVRRLEAWHIPRLPAAILVLGVAAAIVAALGWVVTDQLIQIAEGLPRYGDNIRRKVDALQGESKGINELISTFEDLGKYVTVAAPRRPTGLTPGVPSSKRSEPVPVELVEQHSLIQTVKDYAGGVLKPLGMVGLIAVFTIFMLIDRENMRNRLLRLMGQQKLQATTKAMDDAGQRVSRYVLMQFAVNAGFGFIIAVGLALLGVPSAVLWGVLGIFLRFLPFIGPVIAGLLPFALTVAVSEGWRTPLFVVALFCVTELIIANFVEPLLYGLHTGLSAVAILVSAIFWTVVWGPVGLVLATPLTVCLTAVGRYSPQLEYLNIVFGDDPVLAPEVIFYQRLLALDQHEAMTMLETLARDKPLIGVFDEIVIPALFMAERDRRTGQLDAKREDFIVQSINEFVTELQEADTAPLANRELRPTRVFCIPAHDTADEIAAAMCAHFLTQEGFPAISFPVTDSPGELIRSLSIQPEDVVCISAVPPFAASSAKKVARDIAKSGVTPIMVAGLWNYSTPDSPRIERLRKSMSLVVATTLADAVAKVRAIDRPETDRPEMDRPEINQPGTKSA
jgi:predicted PurR-regulated permease PerM/methylmalonyl-CoA mutase cobalamin-binding subunit